MKEFWNLIFVSVFAINSLEKTESVQLEETPLKIIDEIFGEGWWDNEKDEEWQKLTLEQNALHQIDRQNTQIGQIEPNSTDQNPPLSDHSGQIEPNSTDQNPLLTESDHSQKAKNSEEQKEIIKKIISNEKRKIIDKFHAMKDDFEQKGKYSDKERVQIEQKIGKHLGVNRKKIYKWKKEFGLSQSNPKNERENLIEKFDQKKAELKRDGFKNAYHHEIDETVARELGLSVGTIYNWKRKLGQTKPQHSQNEQKELMKHYYEIKDKTPQIIDEDIAKILKIGRRTLIRWKRQFKRQQFHQNSVDGHSLEENAVANVQEIENSIE